MKTLCDKIPPIVCILIPYVMVLLSLYAHSVCTWSTSAGQKNSFGPMSLQHWRQQTSVFTWHSGSWWCTTIPNQSFHMTLWLMMMHYHTKPIFSHDTLAHDDPLPYQTNLFTWHSGSWWCITSHKFSDKRLSGSDDIIQAKPRHMDKWFQYISLWGVKN